MSLIEFIEKTPKAELHLHIEGTLEPDLMFLLAKKNNIQIPFKSIEDVKRAYNFDNLESFLKIYYQGAKVLVKEQDFFEQPNVSIQTHNLCNSFYIHLLCHQ